MAGNAIPFRGCRSGVCVVIEAALPQRPRRAIGVLLIDAETDRGFFRLRPAFDDIADADDAEVLQELKTQMRVSLGEMGARAFLESLEDSASNAIRISERRAIEVDAFTRALDRLYSENVEPVAPQQFLTHVPLYSLKAAAGDLGEDMESLVEDWVPAPEGMRLSKDLFVGHVVGRSMEPRIPDGSLNLFRFHPQGSRQGKIVLVKRRGVLDETDRYTIKRYTSQKRQTGEDQWEHERITLEPLNPEFEPWDAGPEDFAVVAEWLRVIE